MNNVCLVGRLQIQKQIRTERIVTRFNVAEIEGSKGREQTQTL